MAESPLDRESLMAACLLSLCPVHDWAWAQDAEESSQTWVVLGVVLRVGLGYQPGGPTQPSVSSPDGHSKALRLSI